MNDSIGVAVIGTGFMGKCHAMAWTAVKGVFGDVPRPRLEIVCDNDETRARAAAEAFGFAQATTDWQAAVHDPSIDVVSIAAPNEFHAAMATAALAAGKHVWCEKPMAVSFDDVTAMRDAAERSGRKTCVGYNYVHNPAVQHAVRLIQSGAIGRVASFRVTMDEDFMADGSASWSLKNGTASGYGVIDDFGCHTVSLAHLLVGDIISVSAVAAKPFATRPSDDGPRAVETDDVVHAVVTFVEGAVGTVTVSRSAWGHKGRLDWEVHGPLGTIAFSQERMNELRLYVAGGEAETNGFRTIFTGPDHPPYGLFCPAPGHGLGFNDLKIIEAAHFLRVIGGRESPIYDFERASRVEAVVHAMARSARDGRTVSV
jgi:predicted dehydrogenase